MYVFLSLMYCVHDCKCVIYVSSSILYIYASHCRSWMYIYIPRRRKIELVLGSPNLFSTSYPICLTVFGYFRILPTDVRGVFRILGALCAPRMLDYPVKSVWSVQKYPKTVKKIGYDVENRSGEPKNSSILRLLGYYITVKNTV